MKKMFFALAALVLAFAGCSQEDEAIQVSEKKAFKVVVNMDKPGFGEDTRAARTGWVEGDEVYVMLDDDLEHLIALRYDGTGWREVVLFFDAATGQWAPKFSKPGELDETAIDTYLASLNSGELKAIYCSSGISYFEPIPVTAEAAAQLTGIDIISNARENGYYDEDLDEYIPNPLGECIMTCEEGDNGTYSVSEGVLTLNITMKPRVAQYTIRDLNIEDGWNISIHGPVNGYAGGIITPDGFDLTLIEDVLYGYPHQNGNDISIFAAPWQSNEDIPDFMLEELPPGMAIPEDLYQTLFYNFTVHDEDANWFEREFDYKEVKIGGAVIMDGPFTEGAESKWE